MINRSLLFVASAGLLVLAGCTSQFEKKAEAEARGAAKSAMPGDEILVTINGQPAISASEFESYYDQLLEQQPQLKQFASFMPDLKQNVFSTLVSQKVLEHWVQDNKIDQKADYQTDKKQLLENIDRTLAIKYFQQAYPVNVSDSDVKKFYEDNKDSIYLMAPAGVNAIGASFTSEAAAKEFLAKVDKPGVDFAKAAIDAKITTRNFGRVSDTSEIETPVKTKILAATKFPSTFMVKADKTFWIVHVKGKDAAKHYTFEQAKEDARNRVTMERTGDVFNKEIDKLKKQYKVEENKDYFAPKHTEPSAMQVPGDVQVDETANADIKKPAATTTVA